MTPLIRIWSCRASSSLEIEPGVIESPCMSNGRTLAAGRPRGSEGAAREPSRKVFSRIGPVRSPRWPAPRFPREGPWPDRPSRAGRRPRTPRPRARRRRASRIGAPMSRSYPPVSIIGAPTDVGAGTRGARMGPEALRVAGLVEALAARGIDVVDRGNVEGPRNPWQPPAGGYRHLDEVVAWNRAVLEASARELDAGRMPIVLGGDHCLAVGSIAAVAAHCRKTGRKLRILWLDAHTDFNTSDITPSGNVHGMPVACLCGIGPKALTGLGGHEPEIDPSQVRQVGIRSVDQEEKRLVKQHGLDIYDMRYIDEVGMKQVMEEALAGMDE